MLYCLLYISSQTNNTHTRTDTLHQLTHTQVRHRPFNLTQMNSFFQTPSVCSSGQSAFFADPDEEIDLLQAAFANEEVTELQPLTKPGEPAQNATSCLGLWGVDFLPDDVFFFFSVCSCRPPARRCSEIQVRRVSARAAEPVT